MNNYKMVKALLVTLISLILPNLSIAQQKVLLEENFDKVFVKAEAKAVKSEFVLKRSSVYKITTNGKLDQPQQHAENWFVNNFHVGTQMLDFYSTKEGVVSYVIFEPLDFSNFRGEKVTFDYAVKFKLHQAPEVKLVYSTDWDGKSDPEKQGTWHQVCLAPLPNKTLGMWGNRVDPTMDPNYGHASYKLPIELLGKDNVYFAFVGKAQVASKSHYLIDNFKVTGKSLLLKTKNDTSMKLYEENFNEIKEVRTSLKDKKLFEKNSEMKIFSTEDNKGWYLTNYNVKYMMKFNPSEKGVESWLVTPKIETAIVEAEVLNLRFDLARRYAQNPEFSVFYSTDYDGESNPGEQGTWNEVFIHGIPTKNITKWGNATDISYDVNYKRLNAVIVNDKPSLYLAFKVKSNDDGGNIFLLDNILLLSKQTTKSK